MDKYKNEEAYPSKYKGVKSYSFIKKLTNKVNIAIYDPPYAEITGGHNLTNCNWSKSSSRVRFNFVFGVVSID